MQFRIAKLLLLEERVAMSPAALSRALPEYYTDQKTMACSSTVRKTAHVDEHMAAGVAFPWDEN
jgi:hypothetical protein